MHRNVHVYVAYRTVLVDNWRELARVDPYEKKPFKGFNKTDEKNLTDDEKAKVIAAHDELEQKRFQAVEDEIAAECTMQLHTAYVSEVAAVAFDFMSPENDTAMALPDDSCVPHFFHLTHPQVKTPAIALLVGLHAIVRAGGSEPLSSKYTSWRGMDPRFLRLAARNQAARTLKDKMRRLYMPLYFQSNTFDWNSCVGAEKYGNTAVLMEQMQLRNDDFKDPLLNELSITLQLFSRFGLAPDVDLRNLVN